MSLFCLTHLLVEMNLFMSLSFDQFMANKRDYGECASWAIWKLGVCEHLRYTPHLLTAPTFHLNKAVQTLNAIATEQDFDTFAGDLHTDVVLVALNFAERDIATKQATTGLAFHAFHEETKTTSDQHLRGNEIGGAHITDLAKFEED